MPESLAVYAPLLPELIIVVGAMVLLMYGVFRPETESEAVSVGWLSILVLAAAGIAMIYYADGTRTLFQGAFIDDGFARFMKLLALGAAAAALMLAFDDFAISRS